MKQKLFLILLAGYLFAFFAGYACASQFEVQGSVSNTQNISTFGTTVLFKNISSQQIFITSVDPTGGYFISLPQGVYDVTANPPIQSGLQQSTYHNLIVNTNISYNASLPTPFTNKSNNSSIQNMFFPIVGALLVLLVITGFFIVKRRK